MITPKSVKVIKQVNVCSASSMVCVREQVFGVSNYHSNECIVTGLFQIEVSGASACHGFHMIAPTSVKHSV